MVTNDRAAGLKADDGIPNAALLLAAAPSVKYSRHMSHIVNGIESRLANRIKAERDARGWSLGDLAERSGVSKAMISKVERGESSPTATLLGHLSGAFGLTVSTLLARAEGAASRLIRAQEQAVWRDPETGFRRTAISPEGASAIQLVRCELPPGASIAYPASSYAFIHQQIWMLRGILHFIEGEETHELRDGDCLQLGSPTNCRFENRQRKSCAYLVVVASHR
jgi:transcriptional regulator with XRE-family HTH domain